MSKKVKKIIHLSLFENSNCVVCNKELEDKKHLHCKGCLDKWLEVKEDSDK